MERRTAGAGAAARASLAALALAAVTAAVAGCAAGGHTATAGPGGQPTPARQHPTAAQPGPSNTPSTTAALPKATCGRISTHGLTSATRVLAADSGALTCFQTAARACRSASLGVTVMGVDTGTSHVLAIDPGGKSCAVTDLSQYYSANFGGSHGKVRAVRCSVAAVGGSGVTLACHGEKVLVPATVAPL